MSWHKGPLASFDIETSGLDTATDRIVTAALIRALRIAEQHDQLQVPARVLHGWQVTMYERWAANYQGFLRRSGKPNAVIDGSWPLRLVEGGGR